MEAWSWEEYRLKRGLLAIDDAIASHPTISSRAQLARALGISKQACNHWWKRATPAVPIRRVLDVEDVLGVPRHVLRPDFYEEE